MLSSKFIVMQPSPQSSLMYSSSMFNSTGQTICNINFHLPDLRLWCNITPTHSAMAKQRHQSLTTPWRDQRVARGGYIKKTEEVLELSSKKWIGHERRYTVQNKKHMQKQEGWNKYMSGMGLDLPQKLSTACLTGSRDAWGVGVGNKGLDVWTERSPLYVSHTLLPD